MYHLRAYGLSWQSDLPLPRFVPDPQPGTPEIRVSLTDYVAQRTLTPLHSGANVQRSPDGFRYTAAEATLDVFGTDRIDVTPGPEWDGELPPGFFGTVVALLLALRGAIPLHGSAVAIDGRALLICGPSGAGKSTLAAGLLTHGARLISDDLSILHPERTTGRFVLYTGRRTLRLFAETAGYLAEAVRFSEPPLPADRKLAVSPPLTEPIEPFPLATVLLLEPPPAEPVPATHAQLAAQLFRPAWMRRFPGQDRRAAALALAARQISLQHFAARPVRDRVTFMDQAAAVLKKFG